MNELYVAWESIFKEEPRFKARVRRAHGPPWPGFQPCRRSPGPPRPRCEARNRSPGRPRTSVLSSTSHPWRAVAVTLGLKIPWGPAENPTATLNSHPRLVEDLLARLKSHPRPAECPLPTLEMQPRSAETCESQSLASRPLPSQSLRADQVNSDKCGIEPSSPCWPGRNPSVLIRSIPTPAPKAAMGRTTLSRNPSVLIRSIPTMSKSLHVSYQHCEGRNPSVLIRSIPTKRIEPEPRNIYDYVAIPPC